MSTAISYGNILISDDFWVKKRPIKTELRGVNSGLIRPYIFIIESLYKKLQTILKDLKILD